MCSPFQPRLLPTEQSDKRRGTLHKLRRFHSPELPGASTAASDLETAVLNLHAASELNGKQGQAFTEDPPHGGGLSSGRREKQGRELSRGVRCR